jgi:hypothetical protein
MLPSCRSPDCARPQVPGSRFCDVHRALFAAVREEIDGGKMARLRSPERRRRPKQTCDVPGCVDWVIAGESRCEYHLGVLDGAEE